MPKLPGKPSISAFLKHLLKKVQLWEDGISFLMKGVHNQSAHLYFLFKALVTSWRERHVSTASADVKDEVQKWRKNRALASGSARQQVQVSWKNTGRVVAPGEELLLQDLQAETWNCWLETRARKIL